MSSKTCFKCFLTKPLEAFYRHAAMKDGHLNKCIECTKACVRENRLNKIDHYRSFDRGRANLPHRVEARLTYQQTDAFRISSAIANKRWAVANAIRRQAQPCFVCGQKADAHHPDYSAPLSVSWLCRPHHAQLHKEHRERIRDAA